jgi:hypothetical protein
MGDVSVDEDLVDGLSNKKRNVEESEFQRREIRSRKFLRRHVLKLLQQKRSLQVVSGSKIMGLQRPIETDVERLKKMSRMRRKIDNSNSIPLAEGEDVLAEMTPQIVHHHDVDT